MDKSTHHGAHCVYVINYHLVWIPRYRKKILIGPIAERLQILLREIAKQYGFELLAQEVLPDHVHVFMTAPPRFAPAEIVRLRKGITSRRLKPEFDAMRRQYWGPKATLWAEGDYVGTAGYVSAETIQRYIEECQKR
jgi:putative transposase